MQLQLQANSYLSELQFNDDVMHEKLLKTSSKNKQKCEHCFWNLARQNVA